MTIAELTRDYRARRRDPIAVVDEALASLARWPAHCWGRAET